MVGATTTHFDCLRSGGPRIVEKEASPSSGFGGYTVGGKRNFEEESSRVIQQIAFFLMLQCLGSAFGLEILFLDLV